MANDCANRLRVRGPVGPLAAFAADAADGDLILSFEKLLPVPAHLPPGGDESISETVGLLLGHLEARSQLYWRIQNWGAKAGPTYVWLEEEAPRGERIYQFDTPNSSARELVIHLIARYPLLRFDLMWAEPGIGFGGRLMGETGLVVLSEQLPERHAAPADWFRERGWDIWPQSADEVG